jgi:hypothetical protein
VCEICKVSTSSEVFIEVDVAGRYVTEVMCSPCAGKDALPLRKFLQVRKELGREIEAFNA